MGFEDSNTHREKQSAFAVLPASLILPLRIFMGATFLYAGVQHLTDPSYFDPSKPGYIGRLVAQYAVGSPIHDFLLGIVAPNAVVFGYMVAAGESLIGVAVLLGFLYRIAAFAGLLLNFTFFLSATWNAFPFYFGSDIVFALCWLTLLLTGPQRGLSIDSAIARRASKLRWLAPAPVQLTVAAPPQNEQEIQPRETRIQPPERAKFYPRQVAEVNRAFERIESQFVSHDETRTILEYVRAFIISLGVDRGDATKILTGLRTLVERDTWERSKPETG
jgi:thiosulfate dehydrogenase [quinone] large subunit